MSSTMSPDLSDGETPLADVGMDKVIPKAKPDEFDVKPDKSDAKHDETLLADVGMKKAIPKGKAYYGMSFSNQVHLGNCYEHCRYFFQRCKRIHEDVLYIYWVMLGYDPTRNDPLEGIKRFTEKDQKMLELKPIDKIPCSHTGFCATSNLEFIDFLDLGEHDKLIEHDLLSKSDHTAPYYTSSRSLLYINVAELPRQLIHRSGKLKYLIYLKPRRGTLGPFLQNVTGLSVLLLRHCELLRKIDFDFPLHYFQTTLTVLEISGSRHLTTIPVNEISQLTRLLCLNLSHLPIQELPMDFFSNLVELRWVILRGCSKLGSLPTITPLLKLEVLDLSHCTALQKMNDDLFHHPHLQMLDLSYTAMSRIPALTNTPNLNHLSLSGCVNLRNLPEDLGELKKLKVLNLCDCSQLEDLKIVFSDQMSCLLKLNISKTRVNHLPSFANLTNLVELSLRGLHLDSLEPLASLSNLQKLDLEGASVDSPDPWAPLNQLEHLDLEDVSSDSLEPDKFDAESDEDVEPDEPYFTGDPFEPSRMNTGFDRFKQEYTKLRVSISNIQNKIRSCNAEATTTCSINGRSDDVMEQAQSINDSLRYIRDSIDMLCRFDNSTISRNRMNQLVKITDEAEAVNFPLNSANVKQLRDIVLKLKLQVPVPSLPQNEGPYARRTMEIVAVDIVNDPERKKEELLTSYDSLTDAEKDCLLCFSVFPPGDDNRVFIIKKRVLIHWWIGEGFIDLDSKMEKPGTMDERGEGFTDPNPNSVEEGGNQILEALVKNGFIQVKKHQKRESSCVCMQPFVRSFVTTKARERGFFDFHDQTKMLTPHFTRSRRACLLKFYDALMSSYNIWADYTDSPKKLKSFETVHTLFNVNESVIDINVEWFSKMKNLSVLHLGSWHSENENAASIEVVDQKFLKYLKKMKQLRLLNLQGLSPITKLPDSICKLVHLRVLHLRGCSSLAELPVDIGYLKNLIHLDITHCRLLSKLPKGLTLLLKLEVLKGFIISAGPPNRNICIFEDLVDLRKLRRLSLVARRGDFPNSNDLQVVYKMKSLTNLKITWEVVNVNEVRSNNDDSNQQVSKGCGWLKRSCWARQPGQNEGEETSASHLHSNLRKLVLIGFPHKSAQPLLSPSHFQKLEELHVVRGNLESFVSTANEEHEWNVMTIHLKQLSRFDDWLDQLKDTFPQLTYVAKMDCPMLINDNEFDDEGVWIRGMRANFMETI